MDCHEARRELERALPGTDRPTAIADHLRRCDACRVYADRLARLDAVLSEEGRLAGKPDAAPFVAAVGRAVVGRRVRRRAAGWSLAAAATALLAVGLAHVLNRPPEPPAPRPERPRVIVTLIEASSRPTLRAEMSGASGFVAVEVCPARRRTLEMAELAELPPAL